MRIRISSVIVLITLVMAGAMGMQATTITFASVGTAADPLQYQTYGNTLVIEQHPGWAAPLPGSSWVSYGVTGNPSANGYFVPANGTVVTFFQGLVLPVLPFAASVTLRADDSSALYVNDTLVVPEAPISGNQYSVCSDFPVGCLVSTQVTANIAPYLHAGANTLRFEVAQRHGSSFGLNYAGTVSYDPESNTPEPATFAMIGLGFTLVGLWRRKR